MRLRGISDLVGICMTIKDQIFSKAFLEPTFELKREIGNVRYVLSNHGRAIHTPAARNELSSKAADEALQSCSANLLANLEGIRWYPLAKRIGGLPPKENVVQAATCLRGLSTYVYQDGSDVRQYDEIQKRVTKIEKLINLKPLE